MLDVQRNCQHGGFITMNSSQSNKKPAYVIPMAAESAAALPEGPEWTYELKHHRLHVMLWTYLCALEGTGLQTCSHVHSKCISSRETDGSNVHGNGQRTLSGSRCAREGRFRPRLCQNSKRTPRRIDRMRFEPTKSYEIERA